MKDCLIDEPTVPERERERKKERKREREREKEKEKKREVSFIIRMHCPTKLMWGQIYICIEGEGAAQGIGKIAHRPFSVLYTQPPGEIWFYSRVSIRAQNWSANNSERIVQIFELFWSYGWT